MIDKISRHDRSAGKNNSLNWTSLRSANPVPSAFYRWTMNHRPVDGYRLNWLNFHPSLPLMNEQTHKWKSSHRPVDRASSTPRISFHLIFPYWEEIFRWKNPTATPRSKVMQMCKICLWTTSGPAVEWWGKNYNNQVVIVASVLSSRFFAGYCWYCSDDFQDCLFKKNQSFNRMSNVRKITWNELTKRNGICAKM